MLSLPMTRLKEWITKSNSDLGRRFVSGSFWSLVSTLFVKSAAIAQAVLLARMLGIVGFGEWGIVLSTLATVGVFANFGLATAATKHVAECWRSRPEQLGALLGLLWLVAVGTGFFVFLGMFSFAEQIAEKLLRASHLAGAIMMAGFIVWLDAMTGIFQGVLAGFERFQKLATINSISALLGFSLVVILAYINGLEGAVSGLLITSTLTTCTMGIHTTRVLYRYGVTICFSHCWHAWRSLLSIAMPTMLASLMTIPIYWVAQVVLVQQVGGYEEMGGYQAGNQWRTVVILFPTLMLSSFLPIISSLLTTNPERILEIQRRALFFVAVFSGGVAILISILSPWLMAFYGDSFQRFQWVMVILAFKGSIEACNAVLMNTIVATGRAWFLLISNAIFGALVIAGSFLLTPRYLALGLAITLLISQGVHLAVQILLARHAIKTFLRTGYEMRPEGAL